MGCRRLRRVLSSWEEEKSLRKNLHSAEIMEIRRGGQCTVEKQGAQVRGGHTRLEREKRKAWRLILGEG